MSTIIYCVFDNLTLPYEFSFLCTVYYNVNIGYLLYMTLHSVFIDIFSYSVHLVFILYVPLYALIGIIRSYYGYIYWTFPSYRLNWLLNHSSQCMYALYYYTLFMVPKFRYYSHWLAFFV